MERWAASLALGCLLAGCGGGSPPPVRDSSSDSVPTDASTDAPIDTAIDTPVDTAIDLPVDTPIDVPLDSSIDASDAGAPTDAVADRPEVSVGPWSEIHPCSVIGGGRFNSPTIAANGSLLAIGGTAPRIYSVGPSSLTLVRTFAGLAGPATTAALSPDGSTIAAGADIGPGWPTGTTPLAGASVAIWRVGDGSLVWARPASQDTLRVALSPDGSLLAIGSYVSKKIEVVRTATGELVGTYAGHALPVTSLAFSPDGATIASGDTRTTIADVAELHLWRVSDRTLVRKLTPWRGGDGLAFSPDGSRLLGGNGALWNIADGAIFRMHEAVSGGGVAYAPDGRTYYATELYRASDGALLRGAGVRTLRSATYLPDSSQIFLVPDPADTPPNNLPFFWRVADGTTGATLAPNSIEGTAGAVSPDGERVVFGSKMFRLSDGAPIPAFAPSGGTVLAFSPDGSKVALTSGSAIGLFDAATGALKANLGSHAAKIGVAAFSPAGDLLASGGDDHVVKIWTVATGAVRMLGDGIDGPTRAVINLSWSPAGDRLASSGGDNVIIWRVSDGTILRTIAGGSNVYSPVFLPDGNSLITTILTGPFPKSGAQIWNVETGEIIKTVDIPGLTRGQALSPAADLAACSADYGTFLWSPSTGQTITALGSPHGPTWLSFAASNGVVARTTASNTDADSFAIYWCRGR